MELSVKVPVAVSCSVSPLEMLGLAGVTPIDTSVADVTVSDVLPEIIPLLTEMLVLPTLLELARPAEPAALLTVAMLVLLEDQITCVVRFCVKLSVYVPVAVNCSVNPLGMLGFAGVTAMDTKLAAVTVSAALPETLPLVAEIVVLPVAAVLANPCEPAALPIVANPVLDEDHVT